MTAEHTEVTRKLGNKYGQFLTKELRMSAGVGPNEFLKKSFSCTFQKTYEGIRFGNNSKTLHIFFTPLKKIGV